MLATATSASQVAAPAAAGTAAGVAKNTTATGAPAATPAEGKSAPITFAPALAALNRAPAEADAVSALADLLAGDTTPATDGATVLPGRVSTPKDPQADSSTTTADAGSQSSPVPSLPGAATLPWLLLGATPTGLPAPIKHDDTPHQAAPSALSGALATPQAALPALSPAARSLSVADVDSAADSHVSLATASAPLVRDAKASAAVLEAGSSPLGTTGDSAGNTTASLVPGASQLPLPNAAPAQNAPAEWAPLKLPAAAPNQWAQPLQQALGERLNVQVGHGIENAVIRLDPPMLGSLEIAIRHQGGALQVQLSASNGEVLSQLQGISDSLRQDLGNRQYTAVTVQVSDARSQAGSGDGQGRAPRDEAQPQARPGRALAEAEQDYRDGAFTLAQG